MTVPFVGSIVSFVVALLVGGLAIYLSARVVVDVDDYDHAVVTALAVLFVVNAVFGVGVGAFGVPGA